MIRGILIPVITPFDNNQRVDEPMLRQLIDFYAESGVQGLFVLGSSGQGPVMSTEERKRAAEAAVQHKVHRRSSTILSPIPYPLVQHKFSRRSSRATQGSPPKQPCTWL